MDSGLWKRIICPECRQTKRLVVIDSIGISTVQSCQATQDDPLKREFQAQLQYPGRIGGGYFSKAVARARSSIWLLIAAERIYAVPLRMIKRVEALQPELQVVSFI